MTLTKKYLGRLSWLAAVVSLLILPACSNVSRFDVPQTEHGPSVASIVNRLRCELGYLARDEYPHSTALLAGDFVVAVQLNLTVNDDGSLAPSFTYTNGLFSFNAGARLEASREQNYTQNLIFSIRQMQQEILAFAKARLPDPYPCNGAIDTELAGDLGIRSAVDMAFTTPNNNFGAKLSGTSGAFGGYVTFTITKNLNGVGPTWTLSHFKGPGNLAGLSEVNTDKLVFAFAQSGATGAVPNTRLAANANVLLDRVLQAEIANQLNAIRISTNH
jgi:hypothetical protein